MKMILPTAIAIGVIIGATIKPSMKTPEYVSVVFEDNHYLVEQEQSILPESKVQAAEELSDIEQMIKDAFPENYHDAITVAKCESGLDPSKIGDKALITYNGDDIVGDSIGLFQIRTGGKDFNRARANNMTPDEFRRWMLDAKENIKYAKSIYDRQGWGPWTCKKDL